MLYDRASKYQVCSVTPVMSAPPSSLETPGSDVVDVVVAGGASVPAVPRTSQVKVAVAGLSTVEVTVRVRTVPSTRPE
ncbi:unannotated protein [freshwater metagenome]|uniref:Unannotated protein n=1 Tax=freshwater metagenome TaxID=449393 RepID=A0A6J7UU88_9ZZZZ